MSAIPSSTPERLSRRAGRLVQMSAIALILGAGSWSLHAGTITQNQTYSRASEVVVTSGADGEDTRADAGAGGSAAGDASQHSIEQAVSADLDIEGLIEQLQIADSNAIVSGSGGDGGDGGNADAPGNGGPGGGGGHGAGAATVEVGQSGVGTIEVDGIIDQSQENNSVVVSDGEGGHGGNGGRSGGGNDGGAGGAGGDGETAAMLYSDGETATMLNVEQTAVGAIEGDGAGELIQTGSANATVVLSATGGDGGAGGDADSSGNGESGGYGGDGRSAANATLEQVAVGEIQGDGVLEQTREAQLIVVSTGAGGKGGDGGGSDAGGLGGNGLADVEGILGQVAVGSIQGAGALQQSQQAQVTVVGEGAGGESGAGAVGPAGLGLGVGEASLEQTAVGSIQGEGRAEQSQTAEVVAVGRSRGGAGSEGGFGRGVAQALVEQVATGDIEGDGTLRQTQGAQVVAVGDAAGGDGSEVVAAGGDASGPSLARVEQVVAGSIQGAGTLEQSQTASVAAVGAANGGAASAGAYNRGAGGAMVEQTAVGETRERGTVRQRQEVTASAAGVDEESGSEASETFVYQSAMGQAYGAGTVQQRQAASGRGGGGLALISQAAVGEARGNGLVRQSQEMTVSATAGNGGAGLDVSQFANQAAFGQAYGAGTVDQSQTVVAAVANRTGAGDDAVYQSAYGEVRGNAVVTQNQSTSVEGRNGEATQEQAGTAAGGHGGALVRRGAVPNPDVTSTFRTTPGQGGRASVYQRGEQTIDGADNAGRIRQSATARGGGGGEVNIITDRAASLSIAGRSNLSLAAGDGGNARVSQNARQSLEGDGQSGITTQRGAATGGRGGPVDLGLHEGAAMSLDARSELDLRGGHGADAVVVQRAVGSAGTTGMNDTVRGRDGGAASLVLGTDAWVSLAGGSRLAVSGGDASSTARGGEASIAVGDRAGISLVGASAVNLRGAPGSTATLTLAEDAGIIAGGESVLNLRASAEGSVGDARLGLGEQALLGLGGNSTLTVAGTGTGSGSRLHLGDRAVVALDASTVAVDGDSLHLGDDTRFVLHSASADFAPAQAVVGQRHPGEGAGVGIQGEAGRPARVAMPGSLVLESGVDMELAHAGLQVNGDLSLGGDFASRASNIRVDDHFSFADGTALLADTTVTTRRLTVGAGRDFVVRTNGSEPLRWTVETLHVEGAGTGVAAAGADTAKSEVHPGRNGVLDLGTTGLVLASDGEQPSRFELQGELRTRLFLDAGRSLNVGSVSADRASVGADATVTVGAEGLAPQTIWQALPGGGEWSIIQSGDGSDIDRPATWNLPESRLYTFGLEAGEQGLVLRGETSDGNALVDDLNLSVTGQAAGQTLIKNAGWLRSETFDLLNTASEAEVRQLAEQVTADTSGARETASLRAHSLTDPLFEGRFRIPGGSRAGDRGREGADGSARGGIWSQVLTSRTDQDRRDGVNGYDLEATGISIGLDRWSDDELVLGLAFTYADTEVDFSGQRRTHGLDTESYIVTHYGGLLPPDKDWFVHWQGAVGFHSHEDSRRLDGLGDDQRADFNGRSYRAQLTGGFDMTFDSALTLSPFGRLSASRVNADAFGFGGAIPRREDPDSLARLEPEIGARILADTTLSGGAALRFRGALSAGYDLLGDESASELTFDEIGETVVVPGVEQAAVTLRTKAGIDLIRRSGVTITLDYVGAFRSDFRSHAGMLRGHYRF